MSERITTSDAGLALRYSEKLTPEQRKAAAVVLARARAASMTDERRSEIAAMGAAVRWAKKWAADAKKAAAGTK